MNSSDNTCPDTGGLQAAMDNALTAKAARRHALAKLPIEEKIRIIVEMQKLANEILVKTGRPARRVWE